MPAVKKGEVKFLFVMPQIVKTGLEKKAKKDKISQGEVCRNALVEYLGGSYAIYYGKKT